MKEMSSVVSLLSFKKKDNKYKTARKVKIIAKNVTEGQLMKLKGIIGAQLTHAKDHMAHKVP